MASGPVVAMVWEGLDAVKTGRAMLGTTNPLQSPIGMTRINLHLKAVETSLTRHNPWRLLPCCRQEHLPWIRFRR